MKFKITADSTCDLPKELLAANDITLIPLTVIKNEEAFKDGITITPADIFQHVANGGQLCSTSAVSVGEYIDYFNQFVNDYDGIIHVNIGSGFSACYQNACLAAEEFDNITVIDSKNLNNGQALVVLKALELANAGLNAAQIKEELDSYVERVEISFLVDKLDYLVKGGRCSSAAALGANLLNLKPCIEVRDGKMSVVKKYRGNFTKAVTAFMKDRLSGREDIQTETLLIPRAAISEECTETIASTLESCMTFNNVYHTVAGCTISCHCGPGTVGIAVVRK